MAKKKLGKVEAELQERGTSNVTVRLSDELIARIDRHATAESRSRANLIKYVLEQAAKTWNEPQGAD
jgi:predicted transcriptional regulator